VRLMRVRRRVTSVPWPKDLSMPRRLPPAIWSRCRRLRVVVEGLVESDREEIVDGRLRRYYRLTPAGGQRLAAEVDQLSRTTAVARRRLQQLRSPA
jgi:hypothetical protein